MEQVKDTFFDLTNYYTRFLNYSLDEEKMKGLNLFLEMLTDKQ